MQPNGGEIRGKGRIGVAIVVDIRRAEDAFSGKTVGPQLPGEFQTLLHDNTVLHFPALPGRRKTRNHPGDRPRGTATVRFKMDSEVQDRPGKEEKPVLEICRRV